MPVDCANPPAPVLPADPAADAFRIYACEGLPAWEDLRAVDALAAADRALALDSDLAPAILLRGLALIRTHRVQEGVTVLGVVEDDPTVGPAAREAIARNEERWSREGVDLLVGLSFPWGVQVGMGFPVQEKARIGVEVGPVGALLTAAPMGIGGTWSWDLGAGLGWTWDPDAGLAWRVYAAVENRRRAASGLRFDVSLEGWSTPVERAVVPGFKISLVGNLR